MTLNPDEIQSIVHELRPLIGGRIQRIDLISLALIVFEIRCPQQTIRLLISAEPGLGRIHLIDRRPQKPSTPPNLQGVFRKWLVGKPIINLQAEASVLYLDCPESRFVAQIKGGCEAFRVFAHQNEPHQDRQELPSLFPLSEEIATKYKGKSEAKAENQLRQTHLRSQRAQLKKNRRLLKNLQGDESKLEKMGVCREQGELLKSNLHRIKRGQKSLEVQDWHGNQLTICLDPSLGPKSNLEALFKRAKKADRGLPRVRERIKTIEAQLSQIVDELNRLEALPIEELSKLELSSKTKQSQVRLSRNGPTLPQPKIRRFVTIDGFDVRVGKGAKENDYLTLRVARGHDLWLHARGCPGAHVVLRLEKNSDPTSEALLDASHLAAFYSDRRADSQVEILYTRAKFVRKSKGAAPGSVTVSKEKTINLRIESARLDRLLARQT